MDGGGTLTENTWRMPKPRKWLFQLRRPENADSTTGALHVGGYCNRKPFWLMRTAAEFEVEELFAFSQILRV